MNCQQYQELISCLIDGELSAEEKALIESHIDSCPECRAMYEDFLALSGMMEDSLADAPDSRHNKIMAGVKYAAAKKTKKPLIIRLRPYMAAAACLVVVVGAVFAMRNGVGYDMAAKSTASAPSAYGYAGGTAADDSLEADCSFPASAPAESIEDAGLSGADRADRNDIADEADTPCAEAPESPADEPSANFGTDSTLNDIQLSTLQIDSATLISIMTDGSAKNTAITDLDALSEALKPLDFHEEPDFNTSALLELKCGSETYILELCYAGEALIVRYNGEYWFASASVEEFLSIK